MTLLLIALCDEIVDPFPLFDETLCRIELSAEASSVKYSEIRKKKFNSVYVDQLQP